MRRYVRLRGIGVEEGAATSLHLATAPELEQVSGRYFVDCQAVACSAAAGDPVFAEKLWKLSEVLTQA